MFDGNIDLEELRSVNYRVKRKRKSLHLHMGWCESSFLVALPQPLQSLVGKRVRLLG